MDLDYIICECKEATGRYYGGGLCGSGWFFDIFDILSEIGHSWVWFAAVMVVEGIVEAKEVADSVTEEKTSKYGEFRQ